MWNDPARHLPTVGHRLTKMLLIQFIKGVGKRAARGFGTEPESEKGVGDEVVGDDDKAVRSGGGMGWSAEVRG